MNNGWVVSKVAGAEWTEFTLVQEVEDADFIIFLLLLQPTTVVVVVVVVPAVEVGKS